MTKIIAFANQKGGVAKTTSAIALAQTLAMEGKRIIRCFQDIDGKRLVLQSDWKLSPPLSVK